MKRWTMIIKVIVICVVCMNVNVEAFSSVSNGKKGGYTINPFEIKEKVVVLTFDDGPSSNVTNKILDVLEQNNIRASFFVIGSNLNRNEFTTERMCKLNMELYPHTNTHDYKYIYSKVENYFVDLKNCISNINNFTHEIRKPSFIRMPGGSDNAIAKNDVLSKIKSIIRNNKVYYIDWNIDSTDALNNTRTKEDIVSTIRKYGATYKIEVILMHDTNAKVSTSESLQEIIDFYNENGYKFKTLKELDDYELSYLIRNKVIYR